MRTIKHAITVAAAGVGLTALLLSASAVQPLKIDFSDETVGAEPKSFLSVVARQRGWHPGGAGLTGRSKQNCAACPTDCPRGPMSALSGSGRTAPKEEVRI